MDHGIPESEDRVIRVDTEEEQIWQGESIQVGEVHIR
jgi:hypothetical protein